MRLRHIFTNSHPSEVASRELVPFPIPTLPANGDERDALALEKASQWRRRSTPGTQGEMLEANTRIIRAAVRLEVGQGDVAWITKF